MGMSAVFGKPDWSTSGAGRRFSSLGDVLREARPYLPSAAVSDVAFARLKDCASTLPASAASHEFWVELRPREPERADLIFGVVPEHSLARDLIPWCRWTSSSAMQACAGFLESIWRARSADMAGRICIEIDLLEQGPRYGVFAKAPRSPGFPDGAAAARALVAVTGVEDDETILDWQFGAAMVTGFVGPVRNIGGFPERDGSPLRLHSSVNDCEGAHEALARLGWEGDLAEVKTTESDYPFADTLTLDTDYRRRRLGRTAGLERGRPGAWTEMNPGLWAERLRWAADAGWCDRDQADAWVSVIGSRVIETEAGPTTLNLGINHVKFVFGDGDPHMKVYVGGNMGGIRSAA